jgi:hypothetical protein
VFLFEERKKKKGVGKLLAPIVFGRKEVAGFVCSKIHD